MSTLRSLLLKSSSGCSCFWLRLRSVSMRPRSRCELVAAAAQSEGCVVMRAQAQLWQQEKLAMEEAQVSGPAVAAFVTRHDSARAGEQARRSDG